MSERGAVQGEHGVTPGSPADWLLARALGCAVLVLGCAQQPPHQPPPIIQEPAPAAAPAPPPPTFEELSSAEHLARAEAALVSCDAAAARMIDRSATAPRGARIDGYLTAVATLGEAQRHLDAIPRRAPEHRAAVRATRRVTRHNRAARRVGRQLEALTGAAVARSVGARAPTRRPERPRERARPIAPVAQQASTPPNRFGGHVARYAGPAPSPAHATFSERPAVHRPGRAPRRVPATIAWPLYGCAENGSCYGDISAATGRPRTVHVQGYHRRDGTYVRGHYRSRPR